METIQISIFFLVSYLISRVFVVLKIPELIIYYLLEKKHISIQKLSLILVMGATLISAVVINMITVLTLMPLVILLQKEFSAQIKDARKLNTLLLLTVLWGANIGGLGTITGTTTNGVLIGFFDLYKVPMAENFTFIAWATWGIPLTLILGLLGWAILMFMFRPGKLLHKMDFSKELTSKILSRRLQKTGFGLAAMFLVSASVLSYLLGLRELNKVWVLVITGVWALINIYLLLIRNWKMENGNTTKLLHLKDIVHNIPKRGLFWVGLAFVVTYILWQLRLHTSLAGWFSHWISGNHDIFLLYWIFGLFTAFSSELVSNTAVQFSMFMVLFPMMKFNPEMSWQGMLIITLCSSCAFMSPLATPSNGLGFGSSEKISIKYMLMAGFVMNVVSSIVIVAWVHYVVPLTLRWFF